MVEEDEHASKVLSLSLCGLLLGGQDPTSKAPTEACSGNVRFTNSRQVQEQKKIKVALFWGLQPLRVNVALTKCQMTNQRTATCGKQPIKGPQRVTNSQSEGRNVCQTANQRAVTSLSFHWVTVTAGKTSTNRSTPNTPSFISVTTP